MAKRETKNAIVLARVSTVQQSLESQTERVLEAAKRDGYADPIIIKNKESAVKKDEAHLLGIAEMKQYIEAGDVECVYCFELSRLSRRPRDLYVIRDYLMEHKVQLVVLNPSFRLLNSEGGLDPTANIVFALFTSMAEQECMLRTERCKRGKLKKKAENRFTGGKCPFGYSRDKDDYFIINPEEANIVKRIYNMYIGGMNRLDICREMRAEGYFTNFISAMASHTHISDILHNPDYTGKNGKPQIISQNLFDRVQKRLETQKAGPRRKTKRVALCRGLMCNSKTQSPRKKYYVDTSAGTYYCLLDLEETKKKFISIHKMDPLLWDVIKKVYQQQRDGASRGKERQIQKQRKANIERKIAHLEAEITKHQGKREICAEKEIMQQISAAKAKEMMKKIDELEARQKDEIEKLRAEAEQLSNNEYKIEDIDALDGQAREELVARLVDHIDLVPVDERRCQLVWRCSIYFKRGDVYFGYINSGKRWGWM